MSFALIHFRLVALRASILFSLLMLLMQNVSYADPGSPLHPNKWKTAVVYQVVHGQKSYLGSISNPVIPAGWTTDVLGLEPAKTRFVVPTIDYEVWLERDGGTLGVWLSSKTQRAGCIYRDGTYLPAHAEDAWVKPLISHVRSEDKNYNLLVNSHQTIREYSLPALTLDELVRESDIIVIGRDVALMRMQHTPVGGQGPLQCSVFLLSIERYLKNDSSSISGYSAPPVIKILQDSGILPWQEDGARSVGNLSREDPLLNVGGRYLVFLKAFDATSTDIRKGYISATVDGITGMSAELDEYYPLPLIGIYSFDHGKVQGYGVNVPFVLGPQIIDVSEQDIVKSIKESMKRPIVKPVLPTAS